jgi:drug/metabolite transporter (DMT)-like permease
MKPQLIVGILILVLGAFIVFRGLNYGSQQSVIQVGDMRASVEARRTIPTWVGAVAIVGGALLVGAGLQRRPRGA